MTDNISKTPIFSLFWSLGIQALLMLLTQFFPFLPIISTICIGGALSLIIRLSFVWTLFNILLPLFLYSDSNINVPNYLFLIAAMILALLHLPAWWSQVPYYPSPKEVYDDVSQLLPKDGEFRFIDIGCGVGKLLNYLSLNHSNGHFTGVEISFLPYIMAKIRNITRPNVEIRYKSFWTMNLSHYDYIYAFLSPAPMQRIWEKANTECKKGALFISNSFKAPANESFTKEVSPKLGGVLYIYQV